jgi:pyrroloquinoline quinone biosynthesis protein D
MVEGTSIPTDARFEIHRHFLFRWEPSQEAYVLLYPEGVVKLNQTAGEILKRCQAGRSVGQMIEELKQVFSGADDEIARGVRSFLEIANVKGWIRSAA